jgi:hypothetical protein
METHAVLGSVAEEIGEAVWADRGKEKRGELGPGREREEWAAERVGPRVLSWVWVALGWFQV